MHKYNTSEKRVRCKIVVPYAMYTYFIKYAYVNAYKIQMKHVANGPCVVVA